MILLNHRWVGSDQDKNRLVESLSRLITLLKASSDSLWSVDSANKVVGNIEIILSNLIGGKRIDITLFRLHCLPTGSIDDISIDNGWGDEWLELSMVIEDCLSDYNLSLF